MARMPSLLDGRTRRARRTRRAIVDAAVTLIDGGELSPTAPVIAEKAGVSLRTVFQHFNELEMLHAAVAERQTERLRAVAVRLPTDRPLDERIRLLATQRARVLEMLTPVRRSAMLREHSSAAIRASIMRLQQMGRREVERLFAAELDALGAQERAATLAALDGATSWHLWEMLRVDQELPVAGAERVMVRMLRSLLGIAP